MIPPSLVLLPSQSKYSQSHLTIISISVRSRFWSFREPFAIRIHHWFTVESRWFHHHVANINVFYPHNMPQWSIHSPCPQPVAIHWAAWSPSFTIISPSFHYHFTIISPSFHHHFTITARTQNSHVRWSNMTCLHVDSHWFNPTFCFLNSRVSCQNTPLMLVGQITSSAVFKSQFVLLQAPFFQVKYPCHEKKPSSGPFGQIHGLRQRQRWPWQDPGCWGPSVGICQYYNRVRRDSFYGHYADMISMAISGITSIYICITYIYTLIYIYIH